NSELALAIALLESQNAEKERTIRSLTDTVEELESHHRAEAALMAEVESARLTMDELQTSLHEIAEVRP
ncbi:hypothetical protein scyTo_0025073, partial [Scyliorhinus torazame]|nr:hypothetical protein [Scyliorhinus torazame]